MCIVAFAWQLFEDQPLILLSNRDEFLHRPTLELHEWHLPNGHDIVAGRDAQAGGTWLGVNANNGCWGVILNYREIVKDKPAFSTSRGQLIIDYLASEMSAVQFARQINLAAYDGFNLVLGDRQQAVMLNNKGYGIDILAKGLYVISNGQPNSDWFKTEKLRRRVRQELLPMIAQQLDWPALAFELLQDSEQAPVAQLPNTGLSLAAERALSSIFIPSNRLQPLLGHAYGTRVSTLLTMTPHGLNMQETQTKDGTRVDITKRFEPS